MLKYIACAAYLEGIVAVIIGVGGPWEGSPGTDLKVNHIHKKGGDCLKEGFRDLSYIMQMYKIYTKEVLTVSKPKFGSSNGSLAPVASKLYFADSDTAHFIPGRSEDLFR